MRLLFILMFMLAPLAALAAPAVPTGLCATDGVIVCDAVAPPPPPPPPAGTATKWHPGHYALTWDGAFNLSYLDKISKEKHIKGVRTQVYWGDIETAPGVYDFSFLSSQLQKAQARGLRLLVMVGYKAYGKTGKDMRCAPADLVASGDVRRSIGGSRNICSARMWRPHVLSRFNSMMRAMGKKFDKEPYLEGIYFKETSNNGGKVDVEPPALDKDAPFVSDFSKTASFNAVVNAVVEARKAFPTTNVFQMVNFIMSPSGLSKTQTMEKLFADISAGDGGVGDPDLICCDPTPNPAVAQRKVYAGKIPLIVENQTIGKRWTKYGQTPAMAFTSAVDDPNGYHANYLVWWLMGSDIPELDYPAVIKVINDNNGRINSACPSNLTCNTQ